MKQKLLLKLALIATILITSCHSDENATPSSMDETTWTVTATDNTNGIEFIVLKFSETTYSASVTYISDGQSVTTDTGGDYTYKLPTVTMVPDNYNNTNFIVATVYEDMMYVDQSSYVFEMRQ